MRLTATCQAKAGTLHFLERLIKFTTTGTMVVLASREPVSIATMKTRTDGGFASLTSKDLRFTRREMAALFQNRFPKVSLPSHLSHKIVSRTEGWAAGIEIFLQGLRNPWPA
jgi:ATP/maltotriose-dependent transcriptional regulator MalT